MINKIYENIIEPSNIRLYFKTVEEFASWLETGTKEDIKCTLQTFEDAELYDDCVIIKKILDAISDTNTNEHKH